MKTKKRLVILIFVMLFAFITILLLWQPWNNETKEGKTELVEVSSSQVEDEKASPDTIEAKTEITKPEVVESITGVAKPETTKPEPQKQQEVAASNQTSSGVNIDMVFIKGGTFNMGSPKSEVDREDNEYEHSVTLSSFYMGKYEVTYEQYDAFCDATGRSKPSDNDWGRGSRPVTNVSWNDAVAYCEWLSKKSGKTYRLPTEAEWEFAARGGNNSKGYKYSGSNNIGSVAWYGDNSGSKTHPVGQKSPNELGIYDMSGNVDEWCSDWYGDYSSNSQTNPKGPSTGSNRVLRGGGWNSYARRCRSASRFNYSPDNRIIINGFRLVLVP